MKTKTTGLVAAACALVALFTSDAAAQAPTLIAGANGTTVTIQWTSVVGALGYTLQAGTSPGAANIASVNLPASQTTVSVTAPNGTYYLRVRAFAGAVTSPFSNEVVVTVGGPPPGPCQAPAAPTATANVSGGSVTINWNAIAGAIGYRVEFSRFSGGTELVQNVGAGATSLSQYVGMLGTFYARVVAGNACGQATSSQITFTIENLNSGSGPRTPNPPPGQLLPRPNMFGLVDQLSRQFPSEFRFSRPTDCGGNMGFMYRLVRELRRLDSRWGLNWKRGWAGTLSEDILAYNPTDRPDQDESRIYLFDVIGGDCGREAPAWGDVTDVTWSNRGQSYCGAEWCARWTIEPYLRAGFPPDQR